MNTTGQFQMFVSSITTQLPTLVVCGVGFVMLLTKGKDADPGRLWALLGFGLAVVLGIVMPLAQGMVQYSARSGGDLVPRAWIFTGMALLWSVLRAVSYACILAALLARRPTPPPPIHPYVDR